MNKDIFNRELTVLQEARERLLMVPAEQIATPLYNAYSELVGEYEKLYKQSSRLVGMGDRMQHSLNELNREKRKALKEMTRLARTDALTSLWNRRYFMELLQKEIAESELKQTPLALLIVDADHFKCINDTHGHDVGDEALKAMSTALSSSVRDVDEVGRYGGEEFVVVLPETDAEGARCCAERIMKAMRAVRFGDERVPCKLTVSIGGAISMAGTPNIEDLQKFADIALYAAKKNGRDRFELYRQES